MPPADIRTRTLALVAGWESRRSNHYTMRRLCVSMSAPAFVFGFVAVFMFETRIVIVCLLACQKHKSDNISEIK